MAKKNNKKQNKYLKKFVIRKYIFANSITQAIKIEKKFDADEIFIDDNWMKMQDEDLSKSLGFK